MQAVAPLSNWLQERAGTPNTGRRSGSSKESSGRAFLPGCVQDEVTVEDEAERVLRGLDSLDHYTAPTSSRPSTSGHARPSPRLPVVEADGQDTGYVLLWQYENGEDWQPFPLSVCRALEGSFVAWQRGDVTPFEVQVAVGPQVHFVDFQSMKRTSPMLDDAFPLLPPSSAVHRTQLLSEHVAQELRSELADRSSQFEALKAARDTLASETASLQEANRALEEEREALKAEKESLKLELLSLRKATLASDTASIPPATQHSRQAWQAEVAQPPHPSPQASNTSWRSGSKGFRGPGTGIETVSSAHSWQSAASQSSALFAASSTSLGCIAEWVFSLKSSTLPANKAYDRLQMNSNDPRRQWLEDYVLGSLMPHRKSYDSAEWCATPQIQIVRISEVINTSANTAYRHQVQQMQQTCTEDRMPPAELHRAIPVRTCSSGPRINEALLFHGCRWEAAFNILREGFDSRLGGTNTGAAFGIGSYFSTIASKADGYTQKWSHWEQRPGIEIPANLRCLLVARVALGQVHELRTADASLRRPPLGADNLRCDSVMGVPRQRGGCVDYDEFIVYQPSQATPQFLIEYEHATSCCCRSCIQATA